MWFKRKEYKNRKVEFPGRRKLLPVSENVYDILRAEGEITEEGDLLNAETLNDLERRIEEAQKEMADGYEQAMTEAATQAEAAKQAASTASKNAEAAAQAATGATEIKNTLEAANAANKFIGADGGMGLGNCNMVGGGNIPFTAGGYAMRFYVDKGTQPTRGYTVVLKGSVNEGQHFLVASNGGQAGETGVSHLTESAVPGVYTGTFTVPSNATRDSIGVYNYPQSTAVTGRIDWFCLYDGKHEHPPLRWTPSIEEVVNSSTKATDIIVSDGKTLEDVLQEGGLLPATNKGTWNPAIALNGDNTAEFQRSSYSVVGSNVTVQTYMRFTKSTAALLSNLNITGLPYVCKAQTKGAAITGWALKAEPTAIYPRASANGSTLSLIGTMGPLVDTTINATQLADGTAWAYITITYPIE